jgi:hypothetical protein
MILWGIFPKADCRNIRGNHFIVQNTAGRASKARTRKPTRSSGRNEKPGTNWCKITWRSTRPAPTVATKSSGTREY